MRKVVEVTLETGETITRRLYTSGIGGFYKKVRYKGKWIKVREEEIYGRDWANERGPLQYKYFQVN